MLYSTFLHRLLNHPVLREDPDLREFLEFTGDLPRSVNTQLLSGASAKKIFKNVGDAIGKIAYKMEDPDDYFDLKFEELESWERQLKRLHSALSLLVSSNQDLASSKFTVSRTISQLANVEEHTGLAQALGRLADTEEEVSQQHAVLAEAELTYLVDFARDTLGMIQACKDALDERVKAFRNWKTAEALLRMKREQKVRLELAGRYDQRKMVGLDAEIDECFTVSPTLSVSGDRNRSTWNQRTIGPRKVRTNRLATEKLADPDVRQTYQNRLVGSLPNAPPSDVNAYWDEIATSLHSAGNFACGTAPPGALKHWISDRTVALLKSRRNIPAGPEHNLVRRIIRRQVKASVKADREVWWTQKAKEMEEAHKSGNARRLFQLIRATGPRKPPVSETIKDRNGVTVSNKTTKRVEQEQERFNNISNIIKVEMERVDLTRFDDLKQAATDFLEVMLQNQEKFRCKHFATKWFDISASLCRPTLRGTAKLRCTDDFTSIDDETLATKLPSSANRTETSDCNTNKPNPERIRMTSCDTVVVGRSNAISTNTVTVAADPARSVFRSNTLQFSSSKLTIPELTNSSPYRFLSCIPVLGFRFPFHEIHDSSFQTFDHSIQISKLSSVRVPFPRIQLTI
ncbi:sorting nexin-1 [Clonorchis sinensis]|uniref:Sorting nexin-1 n=1 Tax=Clonorchis sinensis TaxID=79923 RepID=G7YGL8_CLOSI|nr:sorting nexin-1 [Clonorchis sinensis]